MEARGRVAWLVSAALLLCAGVTAGCATYLTWLPCRGSMLVGTMLESGDGDVPPGCYERMDQGFPYQAGTDHAEDLVNGLIALSLLAGALAWLVLLTGRPWRRGLRWCLLAPAVALGVAAMVAWLPWMADRLSLTGALLSVDVATLVAVIALVAAFADDDQVPRRLGLPLLAVGTLGLSARVADYVVMVGWSELDWDTPPGTGYVGAALLVVASISMLILIPRRLPSASGGTAADRGQRRSPEIGSLPA